MYSWSLHKFALSWHFFLVWNTRKPFCKPVKTSIQKYIFGGSLNAMWSWNTIPSVIYYTSHNIYFLIVLHSLRSIFVFSVYLIVVIFIALIFALNDWQIFWFPTPISGRCECQQLVIVSWGVLKVVLSR